MFMRKREKERATNDESKENKECFDCCGCHNGSDHLVSVFEVLRERDSCLYIVMEYMKDGCLQDYIAAKAKSKAESPQCIQKISQNGHTFRDSETRSILCQIFHGLRHIHSLGYVHRDIKPENILLHGRTAKLADFSLARPFGMDRKLKKEAPRRSCNQASSAFHCFKAPVLDDTGCTMTNYIGTRWYRAPELLRTHSATTHPIGNGDESKHDVAFYTEAIDTFAMGCVAAELYRCRPLFEGRDEPEQLRLIENLLLTDPPHYRTPTSFFGDDRAKCCDFLDDYGQDERNEGMVRNRLASKIETTDQETVRFIHALLHLCPERRPTAWEALRHSYFKVECKNRKSCETQSVLTTALARASSLQRTSESMVTPPLASDRCGIYEPRSTAYPRSIGNTGAKSSRKITPMAMIAPTTGCNNTGHKMRLETDAVEQYMGIPKQSPWAFHESWLKRKRPRLRPSKIFKID